MRSRFRAGVLLAAVVAMLAIAPTAFAKGGTGGGGTGGGGGGTCASISNFVNTPTYVNGGAAVATSYTINQGCFDEFAASVSLVFHNDDTGFTGTEVTMTPLGTWNVSRTWLATFSTRYTLTLSVYSANGKLQDTQKQTLTTLGAPGV